MRFLARWLRTAGAVNIGLGVTWLPFLEAARLGTNRPPRVLPLDGTAYESILGYTMLFGLDLIALGVILLIASRRPAESLVVTWLAIAMSIVRGVVTGIHLIAIGYSSAVMLVLIGLHLAIIATGLLALRAASWTASNAAPIMTAPAPAP